jgi:hypothetical protein
MAELADRVEGLHLVLQLLADAGQGTAYPMPSDVNPKIGVG